MGITPGVDPAPVEEEPLLSEGPLPPDSELAEKVEAIDERIREAGPQEVREADEDADVVKGGAADDADTGPDEGSAADAEHDPTSDQGADPEDPEAQQG